MRFEVVAAFLIGVLLPLLETVRRGIGHWAVHATTMFEDYLAGALLLLAACASRRGAAFARPLLLAVWASTSGMMTLSLFGQLEVSLRGVDLEPRNGAVLVFKLLLWLTCIAALWRSFRAVQEGLAAPASAGAAEAPSG